MTLNLPHTQTTCRKKGSLDSHTKENCEKKNVNIDVNTQNYCEFVVGTSSGGEEGV